MLVENLRCSRRFRLYWSSQGKKSVSNVLKLSPIQSRLFWAAIYSPTSLSPTSLWPIFWSLTESLLIFILHNSFITTIRKEDIRSFLCGLLIFSAKMITLIQKSINFYSQVDGIYWTEIKNNFSIKCCSLSVMVMAIDTLEVLLFNGINFRVCVEMRNWLWIRSSGLRNKSRVCFWFFVLLDNLLVNTCIYANVNIFEINSLPFTAWSCFL